MNWPGRGIRRRRRGRYSTTCAVRLTAGAGFGDVVKLTFFVLNVADLPAVQAARDAVIDTARPPASTAVQVAALVAPGYLLEVAAWALAGD